MLAIGPPALETAHPEAGELVPAPGGFDPENVSGLDADAAISAPRRGTRGRRRQEGGRAGDGEGYHEGDAASHGAVAPVLGSSASSSLAPSSRPVKQNPSTSPERWAGASASGSV